LKERDPASLPFPVLPATQDIRSAREAAFYHAVWPAELRSALPAVAVPLQQGGVEFGGQTHDEDQVLAGLWGQGKHYGTQQAQPRPQDMLALRPFIPQFCE
jgi:hypothetical protein